MKLNFFCVGSALRRQSLLLFVCIAFSLPVRAQDNQTLNVKNDYLLIINTYTSDAPWSNAIIEPVQKWVSAERNVAVFVEHLNMLIVSDDTKFGLLEDALFKKYSDKAPKGVLLLGNSTLLLRDEIRTRWGDVPIVLCAEEEYFGSAESYIY